MCVTVNFSVDISGLTLLNSSPFLHLLDQQLSNHSDWDCFIIRVFVTNVLTQMHTYTDKDRIQRLLINSYIINKNQYVYSTFENKVFKAG